MKITPELLAAAIEFSHLNDDREIFIAGAQWGWNHRPSVPYDLEQAHADMAAGVEALQEHAKKEYDRGRMEDRADLKNLLNEILNYLNWHADDLSGDDLIGDGRKTIRYKEIISKIESTLAEADAKTGEKE